MVSVVPFGFNGDFFFADGVYFERFVADGCIICMQLRSLLVLCCCAGVFLSLPGRAEDVAVRTELTNAEMAEFRHLKDSIPITAGYNVVTWDASRRTLVTRYWLKAEDAPLLRYAEMLQRISPDGMQMTTLTRVRPQDCDDWSYSISTRAAVKPYLFMLPPDPQRPQYGKRIEEWVLNSAGGFRCIHICATVHPNAGKFILDSIYLTPPLREPQIELQAGVEPLPPPEDEPVFTNRGYHRRCNPAVYDAATRILTWECHRHLDTRRNYKSMGPRNIYRFRVAADNKSVEITRRLYVRGYSGPWVRTCRLTTTTPGEFKDSFGNVFYFTLTEDGHVATFSRNRSSFAIYRDSSGKMIDAKTAGPLLIYPKKEAPVPAAE